MVQKVYSTEGDSTHCGSCTVHRVHAQRVHGAHTESTQCRD